MYGDNVHQAIMEAKKTRGLSYSEVTMHFLNSKYDEGQVVFRHPIPIRSDDTRQSLKERVNKAEHERQPVILDLLVRGEIALDKDGTPIFPK